MIRATLWFCGLLYALPQLASAASCTLSVADLAFGPYRPGQTGAIDGTGSVGLACEASGTQPETVTYSLQLGPSGNGQRANRELRDGNQSLRYNLFIDPARSQVWGDGSEGTAAISGVLTPPAVRTVQHLVHGRLYERQAVAPGTYADVLQVLLLF